VVFRFAKRITVLVQGEVRARARRRRSRPDRRVHEVLSRRRHHG